MPKYTIRAVRFVKLVATFEVEADNEAEAYEFAEDAADYGDIRFEPEAYPDMPKNDFDILDVQ